MTADRDIRVPVSSKVQIALPTAIRKVADIRQGDRLTLVLRPDSAILMRRVEVDPYTALIGAWREGDASSDIDELLDELRGPANP